MKITLNDAEQRLAKYLSEHRQNFNSTNKVQDKRLTDKSAISIHLNGVASEIAFCKLCNIYPDMDTEHYPSYDAVLPDGRTVDIKSTSHPNGRLITPLWKAESPPDIYVLMIGEFPTYEYRGYCLAHKFLIDENISDIGHGDCFVLDSSKLIRDIPISSHINVQS